MNSSSVLFDFPSWPEFLLVVGFGFCLGVSVGYFLACLMFLSRLDAAEEQEEKAFKAGFSAGRAHERMGSCE